MKRILVGIDGSRESLQAAVLAANLAHATHRELQLAHVLPDAVPTQPEAFSTEQAIWRKDVAEQGNKLLSEVTERVARPDTGSRSVLVESARPAEALAELAREPDVDLVVVGHRGRSAMARALLGSVADRLVQISPKPVLVVR
jgi:nucleotide-binding universal stress UspA family protein